MNIKLKLKLVEIGDEVGVIFPDDIVSQNGFKEGDILKIGISKRDEILCDEILRRDADTKDDD